MTMAWGGSLNKDGSDHIRNLREADNVLKFLERLKQEFLRPFIKIIEDPNK